MHCYTQRKRERIGEIPIADMVVFKNEHSFLIEQVSKKTSQKKIQVFNYSISGTGADYVLQIKYNS